MNKRLVIIISIALVLAAATAGALWAVRRSPSVLAVPTFVFHSASVPGWWSPGSYPIQSEEQHWPEGLGSSLTIFDSGPGGVGNCHVSAFHWSKLTQPEVLLKEREEGMVWNDSAPERRAIKTLSIKTPEGAKDYELHQYELVGNSSQQYKRGVQLGYVQLAEGYIEVQSHCAEYEELEATLPVLSAIELMMPNDQMADRCIPQDWLDNNCVPAGECEPSIKSDNVIYDCFGLVKDYDSKFDPEI